MHISNFCIQNYYNNLLFGANKLSSGNVIKKINNDGTEEELYTDFIEFDKNNPNDKKLFEDIYNNTEPCSDDDLINFIAYDFSISTRPCSKEHFYALSKPQTNYDKVENSNILGFVKTIDDKEEDALFIDCIQSKDNCRYDNKKRIYKKVGNTMLDCITEQTERDIELFSLPGVIPFYTNYGFKLIDSNTNLMRLKRNNK